MIHNSLETTKALDLVSNLLNTYKPIILLAVVEEFFQAYSSPASQCHYKEFIILQWGPPLQYMNS